MINRIVAINNWNHVSFTDLKICLPSCSLFMTSKRTKEPKKGCIKERRRKMMYIRLVITSGIMFLAIKEFLPFKNFSRYFSSLCFYLSDKTDSIIGVFLKISSKNIWAATTKLKTPMINIINYNSEVGEIKSVSSKTKFGFKKFSTKKRRVWTKQLINAASLNLS